MINIQDILSQFKTVGRNKKKKLYLKDTAIIVFKGLYIIIFTVFRNFCKWICPTDRVLSSTQTVEEYWFELWVLYTFCERP